MISPKLIILLVIVAAFGLLAATANHYHNKYVEAQQIIAVKQVELDNALKAAKECSDNTRQLATETAEKVEKVAKAQAEAAAVARGNYSASNKILEAVAANPDKCVAAAQLVRDYKDGKFRGEK